MFIHAHTLNTFPITVIHTQKKTCLKENKKKKLIKNVSTSHILFFFFNKLKVDGLIYYKEK
jgi:hypothetical protein